MGHVTLVPSEMGALFLRPSLIVKRYFVFGESEVNVIFLDSTLEDNIRYLPSASNDVTPRNNLLMPLAFKISGFQVTVKLLEFAPATEKSSLTSLLGANKANNTVIPHTCTH